MDITPSIAAKSDQWNADDLIGTSQTVTIDHWTKGTDEQPNNLHLVETPERAYRPSKSMARVIVQAWGKESDNYAGKRLTLYRDPDIKFAGQKVGGICISHMSGITKPLVIALTAKRGSKVPFTVEPLPEAATRRVSRGQVPASTTEPTPDEIAACTDKAELGNMWKASGPELRAQVEARVATLDATAPSAGDEE